MKVIIFELLIFVSLLSYAEDFSSDPVNAAEPFKTICSDKLSLQIKAIDNLNEKLSQIPISKIGNIYFSPIPQIPKALRDFLGSIIVEHEVCVPIVKNSNSDVRGAVVYSRKYYENLNDAEEILGDELEKNNPTYVGEMQIFTDVGSVHVRSKITSYMATRSILYNEK